MTPWLPCGWHACAVPISANCIALVLQLTVRQIYCTVMVPQVNEMPGTYAYHDHPSQNRGDGLQGPLIVQPHTFDICS